MSYYFDDGAWGNDGDGDSGADNGMREGDLSGGCSDYDGDARGPSWDAGGVYETQTVFNTMRKSGAAKMDELEAARLNYDRAMRDLNEAEARATRFGKEPALGVVVTFRKTYSLPSRSANRNRVYNYAAIRAQNGWNLTGRETGTKTWVELNEFADDDTLRVATGWDTDPTTAVTSNVGHGFDGQGNGFLAFQMPVVDTSLLVGQLPPSGTRYEVSTTLSADPANADDENTDDMVTVAVVMEEIMVLGHVVARRPVKQFASGEDYSSEQAEAAAQDFAEKLNERDELAGHLAGVTPVTER